MTTIDFEGFVEFLMQLSVHLYSYDSAMTPAEYLQKLFEHFRNAATKTGSNLLKLF
jgi:DNA-binding MurR/RpiR family transcriptional regulator